LFKEGVGKVAPQPKCIEMSEHEMVAIKKESESRAEFRAYKNKSDAWSNGLMRDLAIEGLGLISQAVRPIFAGTMGEYACVRHINKEFGDNTCAVDLKLRAAGDYGIDIKLYLLTMQVKTAQGDYGNLIKRVSESGRIIDVPAKAIIFCQWGCSSRVQILGWIWTDDALRLPVVDSHRGNWKNVAVPNEELLPINRLMDELAMRQEVLSSNR
jgi:hypothetical protein